MITFLQQALSNKNTFATVTDPTRATHFQRDDGQIQDIAELSENSDQSEVAPLDLPTLNFGDEETISNEDTTNVTPLELPSLF